jgi:hypothetical protein
VVKVCSCDGVPRKRGILQQTVVQKRTRAELDAPDHRVDESSHFACQFADDTFEMPVADSGTKFGITLVELDEFAETAGSRDSTGVFEGKMIKDKFNEMRVMASKVQSNYERSGQNDLGALEDFVRTICQAKSHIADGILYLYALCDGSPQMDMYFKITPEGTTHEAGGGPSVDLNPQEEDHSSLRGQSMHPGVARGKDVRLVTKWNQMIWCVKRKCSQLA